MRRAALDHGFAYLEGATGFGALWRIMSPTHMD